MTVARELKLIDTLYNPMSEVDSIFNLSTQLTDNNLLIRPAHLPKIAVIDDDPLYCRVMTKVADQCHLYITCFSDLDSFFKSYKAETFNVAILDYYLGPLEVTDSISSIEVHNIDIPIVVISSSNNRQENQWPDQIKSFIHKALGPYAAIDAAFEAFTIDELFHQIDNL